METPHSSKGPRRKRQGKASKQKNYEKFRMRKNQETIDSYQRQLLTRLAFSADEITAASHTDWKLPTEYILSSSSGLDSTSVEKLSPTTPPPPLSPDFSTASMFENNFSPEELLRLQAEEAELIGAEDYFDGYDLEDMPMHLFLDSVLTHSAKEISLICNLRVDNGTENKSFSASYEFEADPLDTTFRISCNEVAFEFSNEGDNDIEIFIPQKTHESDVSKSDFERIERLKAAGGRKYLTVNVKHNGLEFYYSLSKPLNIFLREYAFQCIFNQYNKLRTVPVQRLFWKRTRLKYRPISPLFSQVT